MPFPILRTPFVVLSEVISLLEPDEIATNLVRSSLNQVGLEATVVELKGKSLRDLLVKNRLFDVRCTRRHCRVCPEIGKGGCEKKGVIYQINCECGEKYAGETGRPLAERFNDHARAAEKPGSKSYIATTWAKHSGEKHGGDPLNISLKILDMERNTVRRKILEGIYIKAKNPALNTKEELADLVADMGTLGLTVSFCSEKVRSLLKRHHQRREPFGWNLYMVGHECFGRIDIETPCHNLREPLLSAKHISEARHESEQELIQMNGYKREFSSDSPVLYFEDRVEGSKMIVEYVTDLFNRDIYGLTINRNDIWAITWINNRQKKKLYGLEIVDNSSLMNSYGDEPLRYILRDNCASGQYIFKHHVSENFRFDGKLGPGEELSICSNGHWVTLDNLINFDFNEIAVQNSRISVSDLHLFLKHWRSGGSHRLAYLSLGFETDRNFENFEEELELVETTDVVDPRIREEKMSFLLDGYSIQRNDGVKATIRFGVRYFILIVWQGTVLQSAL
ncbi:hypothetical protein B9Z55_004727 [Caenorhabditis nigoni]|uniref:Sdz-33 F-box domain-containing protein n=1 Tax=Caenorhabditis nigoni TaxID=1611254 RepID=A0A2G5UXS4_9PELO|nr:hypothetical protein B9Z55_004727 [Caenorhabditis nigoni]